MWDRVFDLVGRPERPLDFLATPHRTGILPFQIQGYAAPIFTNPARTGFWQIVHPVHQTVIGSLNMIEEFFLPDRPAPLKG